MHRLQWATAWARTLRMATAQFRWQRETDDSTESRESPDCSLVSQFPDEQASEYVSCDPLSCFFCDIFSSPSYHRLSFLVLRILRFAINRSLSHHSVVALPLKEWKSCFASITKERVFRLRRFWHRNFFTPHSQRTYLLRDTERGRDKYCIGTSLCHAMQSSLGFVDLWT